MPFSRLVPPNTAVDIPRNMFASHLPFPYSRFSYFQLNTLESFAGSAVPKCEGANARSTRQQYGFLIEQAREKPTILSVTRYDARKWG